MFKKVVTLYIDDASLKLLVAQGRGIKKWAGLSLEPGLVRDGVISDPALLADMLKGLLNTQGVRTRNVIVGLSGLHCLSRVITLPNLPKAVVAEAVTREAERLLPVALEEFYISWQIIDSSSQGMRVFLAACPRNATDILIETLRQAGIKPYFMDIASLALARVASRATAILVDNRVGVSDIVIMVRGVPELIRSLSLLTEDMPSQGKLSVVREELERTIKFYNSNNPEKSLDSDVPVYVSGELSDEPELLQSLSEELGHPVSSLVSPLKCPEELDVTRYAVNIGLALRELSPGKVAGKTAVNLNVLPKARQSKPPSLAKVLIPAGLIVAIGLLVSLVMVVQDTTAATASVNEELDSTNQIMKQRLTLEKSQNKDIAGLQEKVTKLETTNNTYASLLDSYSSQQEMVNGDLIVAVGKLSGSISLTAIDRRGNILTISGLAQSDVDVLAYARSLDDTGRFSKTTITTRVLEEDGVIDFTIVLDAKS